MPESQMSPAASDIRESGFTVGIIGMGRMGQMYAEFISRAGWKVNICDQEDKYHSLVSQYKETPRITILRNGHFVSRLSDYIIYCVETENIESVVACYGQSTKSGAIVGGLTSCKTPEIAAFEKHLQHDVDIVTSHSMHGPNIDPRGQPLVVIRHRASQRSFEVVKSVLESFGSNLVYLSAEEHDRITADTQAVTHAAFLSMGTAWHANGGFPWENTRWCGGIESIKVNLTRRIYSNKWHVYAGLAMLNPNARLQISQYAQSVTQLFKLMLVGDREKFEARVRTAGEYVFGKHDSGTDHGQELLLRDDILSEYSLNPRSRPTSFASEEDAAALAPKPNSQLSMLAMVDSWHILGISPYQHIICSTPLFRLWLGSAEYLFRHQNLLNESINAAMTHNSFRSDDLEFMLAAREWSQCVMDKDFDGYKRKFEATQAFFREEGRLEEATRRANEMIRTIHEMVGELEGRGDSVGGFSAIPGALVRRYSALEI